MFQWNGLKSTLVTGIDGLLYAEIICNVGLLQVVMTTEELMAVLKPAICATLKCPATAQFPEEMIRVSEKTDGYHIEGVFDSQNAFGAMIRDTFKADVTSTGKVQSFTTGEIEKEKAEERAKQRKAADEASNEIIGFIIGLIVLVVGIVIALSE